METGTILAVVLEELAHKAALILQSTERMQIHVTSLLSFFVHCGPDYTLSTSKVKWFSCTKISLFWINFLKFSVNMYKKKARALVNYPIVCRLFTPSHSLSKEPLNACPSTCNPAVFSLPNR